MTWLVPLRSVLGFAGLRHQDDHWYPEYRMVPQEKPKLGRQRNLRVQPHLPRPGQGSSVASGSGWHRQREMFQKEDRGSPSQQEAGDVSLEDAGPEEAGKPWNEEEGLCLSCASLSHPQPHARPRAVLQGSHHTNKQVCSWQQEEVGQGTAVAMLVTAMTTPSSGSL